jgi:hypothetical protein
MDTVRSIVAIKTNVYRDNKRNLQELLNDLNSHYYKTHSRDLKKAQDAIDFFEKANNHMEKQTNETRVGVDYYLGIYDSITRTSLLLDIIKMLLCKIVDTKDSGLYITQSNEALNLKYYNRTNLFLAKLRSDYFSRDNEYEELCINELHRILYKAYKSKKDNLLLEFDKILCLDYFYSNYVIYRITNMILDSIEPKEQHAFMLINKIEKYKNIYLNYILELSYEELKPEKPDTQNNPYYKSFSLMECLNPRPIENICQIVYGTPCTNIAKKCEENQHDLILVKSMQKNGVEFSTKQLFENDVDSASDDITTQNGINRELIKKYKTIKYSNEKNDWNMGYEYLYKSDSNKFVLVIKQVTNSKYTVLHTLFTPNVYALRKNSIRPFIDFVCDQDPKLKFDSKPSFTRVHAYNKVMNNTIANNMFLCAKPNVEKLKIKSQIVDPKYLRNEIYIRIINLFKKNYNTKEINSLYSMSELVHREEYYEAFSNVIINNLMDYINSNQSAYMEYNIIPEVYTSFLSTLFWYQRDFNKNMHDKFIEIMEGHNDDLYELNDFEKDKALLEIFDSMVTNALNKVITNDNNMYSILLYKLYLFRISLID